MHCRRDEGERGSRKNAQGQANLIVLQGVEKHKNGHVDSHKSVAMKVMSLILFLASIKAWVYSLRIRRFSMRQRRSVERCTRANGEAGR